MRSAKFALRVASNATPAQLARWTALAANLTILTAPLPSPGGGGLYHPEYANFPDGNVYAGHKVKQVRSLCCSHVHLHMCVLACLGACVRACVRTDSPSREKLTVCVCMYARVHVLACACVPCVRVCVRASACARACARACACVHPLRSC